MTTHEEKREAVAVGLVRERKTGKLVAVLYRWNDGTTEHLWLTKAAEDLVHVSLPIEPRADPDDD